MVSLFRRQHQRMVWKCRCLTAEEVQVECWEGFAYYSGFTNLHLRRSTDGDRQYAQKARQRGQHPAKSGGIAKFII